MTSLLRRTFLTVHIQDKELQFEKVQNQKHYVVVTRCRCPHPGIVPQFLLSTFQTLYLLILLFLSPLRLPDFDLESIPPPDYGWSIISSSGRPQWKPHQLSASIRKELPLPPHTGKQIGLPVDFSHFLFHLTFLYFVIFFPRSVFCLPACSICMTFA